MARPAPGLGDDPRNRQCPEAHRLTWKDFMCDQDDRLVGRGPDEGRRRGGRHVRSDPGEDVAKVGDPFPEEVLLDPGEARSITLEDDLQSGERGQALGFDQVADLGEHRPIVDDLEVRLEDRRFGRAELLADLDDDRLQLIR